MELEGLCELDALADGEVEALGLWVGLLLLDGEIDVDGLILAEGLCD